MKTVTNFEILKNQPIRLIIGNKHDIKSFTNLKDFIDFLSLVQNIEILDNTEKRYLQAVLRPFVSRIISVEKVTYASKGESYLSITLAKTPENVTIRDWSTEDKIILPMFNMREMYTGMTPNYSYTLEELGLFSD